MGKPMGHDGKCRGRCPQEADASFETCSQPCKGGEGVPAHSNDSSNPGLFLYIAPGAATWK